MRHSDEFGLIPGCGTVNTNFFVRQLKEKYLAKNKNLYFASVYLAKTLDPVLRDVV